MKHNDGIIKFQEEKYKRGNCGHCNEFTLVWQLKEVALPEVIEPSNRLIIYKPDPSPPGYKLIKQIGIGCGCYAKFHRQIAHILNRMQKG